MSKVSAGRFLKPDKARQSYKAIGNSADRFCNYDEFGRPAGAEANQRHREVANHLSSPLKLVAFTRDLSGALELLAALVRRL